MANPDDLNAIVAADQQRSAGLRRLGYDELNRLRAVRPRPDTADEAHIVSESSVGYVKGEVWSDVFAAACRSMELADAIELLARLLAPNIIPPWNHETFGEKPE